MASLRRDIFRGFLTERSVPIFMAHRNADVREGTDMLRAADLRPLLLRETLLAIPELHRELPKEPTTPNETTTLGFRISRRGTVDITRRDGFYNFDKDANISRWKSPEDAVTVAERIYNGPWETFLRVFRGSNTPFFYMDDIGRRVGYALDAFPNPGHKAYVVLGTPIASKLEQLHTNKRG